MYKKIPVVGHFLIRPYLAVAVGVGVATAACLPAGWNLSTQALTGWDAGLLFYLGAMLLVLRRGTPGDIRRNAGDQEEGRMAVLLYAVAAVVASLAAIVQELGMAKDLSGQAQLWHIALAGATVLLSWFFMHTMFAIHYAHEYYSRGADDHEGGLDFPGKDKPDYWDFLHFSYIIGAAAQTADIAITSRSLRRVCTVHSVIAFFFNTTILALLINSGASLGGN